MLERHLSFIVYLEPRVLLNVRFIIYRKHVQIDHQPSFWNKQNGNCIMQNNGTHAM